MNLRDEAVLFIKWLESENLREKQYSVHNTLRAYRQSLHRFFEFIAPRGREVRPTAVTQVQIKEWATSGQGVAGGVVKPRTINQRLGALRAFYKYLKQEQTGLADPTEGIRFARTQRGESPHMTAGDANRLIQHLEGRVKGEEGSKALAFRMRDALLFKLLWVTGCRIAELSDLETSSIEFSGAAIRIHFKGKGGKARVIPITLKRGEAPIRKAEELQAELTKYLEAARPRLESPKHRTSALFLGKNGTRLTTRSIARILDQLGRELGLPRYTPHSLRHGVATKLLENEVDLKTISEILGHASAAVTAAIYLHTDEKRKAEAMSRIL